MPVSTLSRRTPLFYGYRALGAKLVEFAGWEMPLQYSGVVDEYQTVRTTAGLFDISHMGRITIGGPNALPFLQRVTTNNAARLADGESQYSMICTPGGGIKDDIFVYRTTDREFLLCVNASNCEKILAWLQEHAAGTVSLEIRDRSQELAQLAIQGPSSRSILLALGISGVEVLKPRQCLEASIQGSSLLIARTGYTGELGYELYIPASQVLSIWNELLEKGKAAGLKPAGLGARDLLRLDMGYLLYGNDISEETTPLEAGAEWVVDFSKGEFIGREALRRQQEQGMSRHLIAFELLEKAVPRHGFPIRSNGQAGNEPIGEVTSGNLSPILQKGIGLGYISSAFATAGFSLAIDIRSRTVPALVVKPPFYKKGKR